MSYLVLRGCDWPASLDVRERIRGGEAIPYDERGDLERHEIGEVIDPPADVLPALLDRGGVLEEHKPTAAGSDAAPTIEGDESEPADEEASE